MNYYFLLVYFLNILVFNAIFADFMLFLLVFNAFLIIKAKHYFACIMLD